jgi:DNA/RNA endonuclease G (NUC1)
MTIKRITTYLTAVLVPFAIVRAAEHCPDCEVSDAKRAQYDALLTLSASQKQTAEARHVAYGVPVTAGAPVHEHILHQKDYVTWYDDELRVPLWVAYRITRSNVSTVRERLDCFRRDPRLSNDAAAECNDYFEPTFDQGHLAPNADFKRTESMMINTYIYSNMTPQHKNFNEHTWERLESLVRMWTQKRGDLFVITGAVFDQNDDHVRDADNLAQRVPPRNRVAIPTHFYKIIIQRRLLGAADSIAILLPHDNAKHTGEAWVPYITDHITTIGEIERVTGINFLPGLSATKRAAMENFRAPALWAKE